MTVRFKHDDPDKCPYHIKGYHSPSIDEETGETSCNKCGKKDV